MKKMENRVDEEYARLNPNRTVPLLKDDDFTILESHSILRYLADKYAPDSFWYPKDLKLRSQIDQFLDWMYNNTRKSYQEVAHLFFSWPDPNRRPKNVQQQIEDWIFGSEADWSFNLPYGWNAQLKVLEDHWLSKSPFLTGSHPTIADLAFYGDSKIFQLGFADFDLNNKFPLIKKWIERMDSLFGHFDVHKNYVATLSGMSEQFRSFGFPKTRSFKPSYDTSLYFS